MTTPLPNAGPGGHDLVARAAGRLESAQDASDQERLRVLDELYADLEAELEREMAYPTSAGPQDFEQAGPAGR
jgi:hypothetical protein